MRKMGKAFTVQIVDRGADTVVVVQHGEPTDQKAHQTGESLMMRFGVKVVVIWVGVQRHGPMVQKTHKTIEELTMQNVVKGVDNLVAVRRQVPMVQKAEKDVEAPMTRFVDNVADTLAEAQRHASMVRKAQKIRMQSVDRVGDITKAPMAQKPGDKVMDIIAVV